MPTAHHPRPAAARSEQAGPGYQPLTKVVLLALRGRTGAGPYAPTRASMRWWADGPRRRSGRGRAR